jgi:hypothetical protein
LVWNQGRASRTIAFDEQQIDLGGLVVHHAEGARIAPGAQHRDVRVQRPVVVEEVDRLRRRVGAPRLGIVRIHGGEEIRECGDQIEQHDHDTAHHGEAVTAEAPPGELELARDREAFLGCLLGGFAGGRG